MPETTEHTKEEGQQVDLNDPRVLAFAQQRVEAAVTDKTRINGELKTEKVAVIAERDAYTGFGSADEVSEKLKRLEDLETAERAKAAKSTPEAFTAEVEKQVQLKAAQHETRMGEIYSKQKDEAAKAVERAEGAEKSEFRSFVLAKMLQAAIPPGTLLFRPGATNPLLNLILPYAKKAEPLADGLDPEVTFEVGGVVLSGSTEGQAAMGFRELLGLLRKPHKDGRGVLPEEGSYYFPDAGAGTDSHAAGDEEKGVKAQWGKMTETQKMDLSDENPEAAKKLIREQNQRAQAA